MSLSVFYQCICACLHCCYNYFQAMFVSFVAIHMYNEVGIMYVTVSRSCRLLKFY